MSPDDALFGNSSEPTSSPNSTPSSIRENVSLVTTFMTLLLVLTALFEFVTERLDKNFERHPHALAIVTTSYKELSILGIVSFLLFGLKRFGVFDIIFVWVSKFYKVPAVESEEIFEKVHMLLFAFAMIYLLICFYFVILHIIIVRQWNTDEKKSKETFLADIDYHKGKNVFRRFFAWFCLHKLVRSFSYAKAIIYYQLRKSLIMTNELDPSFDFAIYMKYCMRDLTERLLHIHAYIWIVLLLLLWINWGRYKLISFTKELQGFFVLVGCGIVILFALIILLVKCHSVQQKILNLRIVKKYNTRNSMSITNEESDDTIQGLLETEYEYEQDELELPLLLTETEAALSARNEQDSFFWFKSPGFSIAYFQAALLLEAWHTGLMVYYSISATLQWYYIVLLAIWPIIFFLFICPPLLMNLSLVLFTGARVDERLMKKVMTSHTSMMIEEHKLK